MLLGEDHMETKTGVLEFFSPPPEKSEVMINKMNQNENRRVVQLENNENSVSIGSGIGVQQKCT